MSCFSVKKFFLPRIRSTRHCYLHSSSLLVNGSRHLITPFKTILPLSCAIPHLGINTTYKPNLSINLIKRTGNAGKEGTCAPLSRRRTVRFFRLLPRLLDEEPPPYAKRTGCVHPRTPIISRTCSAFVTYLNPSICRYQFLSYRWLARNDPKGCFSSHSFNKTELGRQSHLFILPDR